jgi:hypothetical protein
MAAQNAPALRVYLAGRGKRRRDLFGLEPARRGLVASSPD